MENPALITASIKLLPALRKKYAKLRTGAILNRSAGFCILP
jgi:hypothetical protein